MRMQWWLSALAVIGAISASPCLSAQPEEQVKGIHLEGEKARTLISLLLGGSYSDNGATNAAIQQRSTRNVEITFRDLRVIAASTYKYDPDDWHYKLKSYHATARVAQSDNPVNIREATALWSYFTDLGLKTDLALEGTYFELSGVHCKIDANISDTVPARFQCELAVPSWALGNAGRK